MSIRPSIHPSLHLFLCHENCYTYGIWWEKVSRVAIICHYSRSKTQVKFRYLIWDCQDHAAYQPFNWVKWVTNLNISLVYLEIHPSPLECLFLPCNHVTNRIPKKYETNRYYFLFWHSWHCDVQYMCLKVTCCTHTGACTTKDCKELVVSVVWLKKNTVTN